MAGCLNEEKNILANADIVAVYFLDGINHYRRHGGEMKKEIIAKRKFPQLKRRGERK